VVAVEASDQRGEPAAAPGSQRGKSSPPALVLTITPSPHVIRTTVKNRVDIQPIRTPAAIAAPTAICTPACPDLPNRITLLTRSLAPRLAR
jgi:hypothetical protein